MNTFILNDVLMKALLKLQKQCFVSIYADTDRAESNCYNYSCGDCSGNCYNGCSGSCSDRCTGGCTDACTSSNRW